MTTTDIPVSLRTPPKFTSSDAARMDASLAHSSAAEIIEWASETFGSRLLLTSSFADTLLINVATRIVPDIAVIFLDTGFHFAETLETVRAAMARYALNLTVLRPDADAADLWADGVDSCCRDRKTTLLSDHLVKNADGWMSGLRRADSPARSDAPIVSLDTRGLVKINPLVHWTDEQVSAYIAEHNVILNPLLAQGYSSIGCWPCTVPSDNGRNGRWSGRSKTECGLHL